MIRLYYYPSTAAMVPHILLEEIGAAYERQYVDRGAGEHTRPEYLRLNPNGLIPVLQDGDLVLYETAAIALHLCDKFPQSRLAPPVGTVERSHFYKWLAWLTNTAQATMNIYYYPERWVSEGNEPAARDVQRVAERKAAGILARMDAQLAHHGAHWFLGNEFSALDAYVFSVCRWTRNFRNERPARDYARLGSYLRQMLDRPSVRRVLANEKLVEPFI